MTDLDQWRIRRETFVTIITALLGDADEELVREAEGLIFWRKRELRQDKVREYKAGERIVYLARDGKTEKQGTIDHLNKFSVSVKHDDPHEGYKPEVVQIERVLRRAGFER